MKLDDLGPRICIMGPSNSGKSTLAAAIARAKSLECVHLDRLRHLPHTNWQPRSDAEFTRLHDDAIRGPAWVIEGNYSAWLPQRFERATGLILIDLSAHLSLWRYVRRAWFESERCGGLAGDRDSVRLSMIRHIVITTPRNRQRYHDMFRRVDVPKIRLGSRASVARFYRSEGLSR